MVNYYDLAKGLQEHIKRRFCTKCLYRGRAKCNPDKFPTYDGVHACECVPMNFQFPVLMISGVYYKELNPKTGRYDVYEYFIEDENGDRKALATDLSETDAAMTISTLIRHGQVAAPAKIKKGEHMQKLNAGYSKAHIQQLERATKKATANLAWCRHEELRAKIRQCAVQIYEDTMQGPHRLTRETAENNHATVEMLNGKLRDALDYIQKARSLTDKYHDEKIELIEVERNTLR